MFAFGGKADIDACRDMLILSHLAKPNIVPIDVLGPKLPTTVRLIA